MTPGGGWGRSVAIQEELVLITVTVVSRPNSTDRASGSVCRAYLGVLRRSFLAIGPGLFDLHSRYRQLNFGGKKI